MAILLLFERFSRQILFEFLFLILSPLPNMMHFLRTFLIYACLKRIRINDLLSKIFEIRENCVHRKHCRKRPVRKCIPPSVAEAGGPWGLPPTFF